MLTEMLHVAKLKHSCTELFGGWNNHQVIAEEKNILQLPEAQLFLMESKTEAATADAGHHVTSIM